jgi:hypothetical protein
MILRKQDAIDAVARTLSPGEGVVEDSVVEWDYGWRIVVQTKRYIETRDDQDGVFGGSMLVEKATGRLIHLSGAFSDEQHLAMYQGGCFRFVNPDIVITAVDDIDKAVGLLAALDLCWVVPEVVCGDTFRIPQDYTVEQLRAHLRSLPCRFHMGARLYWRWSAFQKLEHSGCIRFILEENSGFTGHPFPNAQI